ncbi:hypothetical protein ACLQ2R_18755 [Streptosporangium sp. DT93]|uniref:hypothetical protein n=1 Tax=Streptosporangium sp. DT93 TaxID=3393428 RepID=UPI003CEAB844
MNADTPKASKLWVDVVGRISWLRSRPFLVDVSKVGALVGDLSESGFRVVRVDFPRGAADSEEALLIELSGRLGFSESGAGNWAAYKDRLRDLKTAESEPPLAVLIEGLDALLQSDVQRFVRCVHNLLSMTEAVGLSDTKANLQIEYFFTGSWAMNSARRR